MIGTSIKYATKSHRIATLTFRCYSTLANTASIDDIRASILKKSGLDGMNNAKSYSSTYHWKPYKDILELNNKMKNIDQLKDSNLLNDVAAVLSPFLKEFDLKRMQNYRLNRVRESLINNKCDVGIFFDPTNIRYITDVPNMQVWVKSNPNRYVVVSSDERDPILLYDYNAAEHLGLALRPDIIQTVYTSKVPLYYTHGQAQEEQLDIFMSDLINQIDTQFVELRKKNKPKINLAVDICRPNVLFRMLNEPYLNIMDGYKCAEQARLIKNNDEYLCLKLSCEVANIACYRMRKYLNENMRNGLTITDNQVFAILSETNIEYGGEHLEGKCLGSGAKSNPWFQESSNNPIEYETLLSFDTDMVGPFGYFADFSRCFYTETTPNKLRNEKLYSYCKSLYSTAFEQIQFNMNLIKSGISYRELHDKFWKCPPQYFDRRYTCIMHGVGASDEYPCVMDEFDGVISTGNDVITPGTCLSVESYIGQVDGKVGVKLEDQIFVHDSGIEVLSTFPFETDLLV